jgi:purine nucleosidase
MLKEKIILDTDIGDDIDDALALVFALNSEELHLLGVTTVLRNTPQRARLAKKLLQVAGWDDIPVYEGCRPAIIDRVAEDEVLCQYSEDMDSVEYNTEADAVDFIIDQVMKSDNDITLVPVGPLTNIAMAIRKKREIKKKIKGISLMGGAYYQHFNEYNIWRDPEAARIVFESGVPIKAIGLDVTLKCGLPSEETEKIFNKGTELTNFLAELITRWRNRTKYQNPCLHDPLAVCAVFNTDILTFERANIGIETRGEFTRGMTFNMGNKRAKGQTEDSNILIAKDVDSSKFIELFMSRILA